MPGTLERNSCQSSHSGSRIARRPRHRGLAIAFAAPGRSCFRGTAAAPSSAKRQFQDMGTNGHVPLFTNGHPPPMATNCHRWIGVSVGYFTLGRFNPCFLIRKRANTFLTISAHS